MMDFEKMLIQTIVSLAMQHIREYGTADSRLEISTR